jgi:hypothetical protein
LRLGFVVAAVLLSGACVLFMPALLLMMADAMGIGIYDAQIDGQTVDVARCRRISLAGGVAGIGAAFLSAMMTVILDRRRAHG